MTAWWLINVFNPCDLQKLCLEWSILMVEKVIVSINVFVRITEEVHITYFYWGLWLKILWNINVKLYTELLVRLRKLKVLDLPFCDLGFQSNIWNIMKHDFKYVIHQLQIGHSFQNGLNATKRYSIDSLHSQHAPSHSLNIQK